ncbi:hypothetical protein UFOVP972_32 [uncultured Caudovirales phage]|uniref:Uncharacterized protein n=1 Tax=uncultured Caudovirales phage TaxID=2100421 RepID=A0A6J5PTU0_9CAUD|nr:hypothetical protein UFOVP972_32 [uncultured Caudovirales phage]
MSEEKTTTEEQEVLIEETQDAMPEGVDFLEEPQAELSELDAAIQARMGQFAITISPADLRYIKNLLNNKIEWKGPNEAYLMLMALLSINGELKERDSSSNERISIHLPSTTLESINFFLNRVTGKGEETAHRLFAVSMLLRPAMEEIKKLDELIEKLQSEEK